MWKMIYWGRIVIEKFMCLLQMEILQEKVKKIIGRQKVLITDHFIEKRINNKLTDLTLYFDKYNVKSVHEQGTGWHGIDIIVFYLLGVEKIYTTDVRDLLQMELMRKVVQFLYRNIDNYKPYKDKIYFLKKNSEKDRGEFLNSINAIYYISDSFSENITLEGCDEGCDMFYSDSVLQRFKASDLKRYIKYSLSLSNNQSFHLHKIDCKDFFAIRNKKIPPLYYLTINKLLWEKITCTKLNYQNRLRIFEFVSFFKQYWGQVETFNEVTTDEDQRYIKKNNIQKIYIDKYTVEEISIVQFDLISSAGLKKNEI